MPFVCPHCQSKSLQIQASLELPPDGWWDEMSAQLLGCSTCGFTALGLYQESRRGALDDEVFQHQGYEISAKQAEFIRQKIQRCPQPNNARCPCAVHQELYQWDANGHWNAWDQEQSVPPFSLHW